MTPIEKNQKMAEAIVLLTFAAMKGAKSATERLGHAMTSGTSGVATVAVAVCKGCEERPPNEREFLFCTLIVAACTDCAGTRDDLKAHGAFNVHINPANVANAFEMYEKLTGRSAKEFAKKEFVDFAFPEVKIDPEQAVSLAKFLPPPPASDPITKH